METLLLSSFVSREVHSYSPPSCTAQLIRCKCLARNRYFNLSLGLISQISQRYSFANVIISEESLNGDKVIVIQALIL